MQNEQLWALRFPEFITDYGFYRSINKGPTSLIDFLRLSIISFYSESFFSKGSRKLD